MDSSRRVPVQSLHLDFLKSSNRILRIVVVLSRA
jgi:hypothetical protein